MKSHVIWPLVMTVLIAAPSAAQKRESGNSRGPQQSQSSPPPATPREERITAPHPGQSDPIPPQPAREERITTPPSRPPEAVPPPTADPSAPVVVVSPGGIAFDGAVVTVSLETGEEEATFVLWDAGTDPRLAAYDFSDEDRCASDAPEADIVYAFRDGNGWMDVSRDTDIRDVSSVDVGSADPAVQEWSTDHSVRLVDGHSYIVWTWDDQLFRFTVEALSPSRIECTWAQVDPGNHYRIRNLARDGVNRPVITRTSFPP